MKNSILGFNQEYAITLRKEVEVRKGKFVTRKIDCTDLVILRWFVDFYPRMRFFEVDGQKYAWLTHKKLMEDLPLIDISKRAFIDRMQKLVDFNILTYKLIKEGGTFSLYGFGDNYLNLVNSSNNGSGSNAYGSTIEHTRVVRSNNIGVCDQPADKDNSVIDKPIKDNSIINNSNKSSRFTPPTLEEVKQYCQERNNNIDAERFLDYYTSNGWMVGKNKMKDWKAAVRTWERTSYQTNNTQNNAPVKKPAIEPTQESAENITMENMERQLNNALSLLIQPPSDSELSQFKEYLYKMTSEHLDDFLEENKNRKFNSLNDLQAAYEDYYHMILDQILEEMMNQ